jgi:UDP-N-acetylglucosamine diphosphorylase/glucosamine-1-phosphate N-acetyltransferase
MRVCLFEDGVERLEPLTLTRPVFDLVCGMTTLGVKQRRHFAASDWGALTRPHLVGICRQREPSVAFNNAGWMCAAPLMLVNGRWLPPPEYGPSPHTPCVGMIEDEVAWLFVFPEQLIHLSFDTLGELIELWRNGLPHVSAGGRLIRYPWDLVAHNGATIAHEFASGGWGDKPRQFGAMHLIGPEERLWIAPNACIDPLVVADTTSGPVVVAENAVVTAFTRLEGPCVVGPHSHVLGAKIRGGVSVGPHCRIGGEVEASIVHGFSNKYHEGFLGHSYLGEWVNLAAGTHNSDLRNDYGPVPMIVQGERFDTGQTKVGCFIGDHTKTGLGTLINTGSHIGAFCNLLPAGRFAPKYVPSFTAWWNGSLHESFTLEQLLQTAGIAMPRRGQVLTAEHVALYQHLYRTTAGERQRAIPAQERQAWRKSA